MIVCPTGSIEIGFHSACNDPVMEIVVNAAMSADGKLSTVERRQVAISGPDDFSRVDALRADVDAVVVGIGTVLADDPRLGLDDPAYAQSRTAEERERSPTRVVVDSAGRTPIDARILDDTARTIILASNRATTARIEDLEAHGAEVYVHGDRRVDLVDGFATLTSVGIEHVLVEGGGELIFSLLAADLVDQIRVFVGNVVIGGREAPTLADGDGFIEREEFPTLSLEAVERIDDGVALTWSVPDVDG